MNQLTTIKYNTKELCAFIGVKPATFRKDPEKHLNKLRKTHDVKVLKGLNSNSPTFYELTPLNEKELPNVLLEASFETELTKNSEKQIEQLLKAVLLDGVVPIHKELAKVIGKTSRTVGSRVAEMKELGILLPIPTKTIIERDEDTGYVINEYEKKICYWYYYDNLPSGDIEKVIDTTDVHNFYGKYFNQQISYLKTKHGKNYDGKLGSGLADNYALKQLNKDFGFHKINRVAEWIVNEEFATKIYQKYRHQAV